MIWKTKSEEILECDQAGNKDSERSCKMSKELDVFVDAENHGNEIDEPCKSVRTDIE